MNMCVTRLGRAARRYGCFGTTAVSPALVQFLPVPGGIVIPISWLSVAAAFIVSCATGVLFGYLPAKKAASLQPVESLRYE